jgi:hypothetical protein
MYSVSRNDVKVLAENIESLAKRVQEELVKSGDFLTPANELVCKSSTMIFALGEVYAMEHAVKSNKQVYHRDSRGRFAKK